MDKLKNRLFIFVVVLTAILLFNIFGYVFLKHKNEQHQLQETSRLQLSENDALTEEATQTLLVLTIHESFTKEQYSSKLKDLHAVAHELGEAQKKLKEDVHNGANKEIYMESGVNRAFGSYDSLTTLLFNNAHHLINDSLNRKPGNYDTAAGFRKLSEQISKSSREVAQNFHLAEQKIEGAISSMNRACILSLSLGLILLFFMVLLPFVTQTLKSQKQVTSSEKKYRYLFDNLPIAMWIYDQKTYSFLEVNEKAVNQYGYSREEFSKLTIFDIRPKAEQDRLHHLMKETPSHSTIRPRGIWTHRTKAGNDISVDIISHIIDYHEEKAILVLANDVTQQLHLQHLLVEEKVSKQKEISKAIISTQEKERSEIGKELHDNVNQILTTVKLYFENIKSYPDIRDKFIDKGIELSQRAIDEIRFLSHQLVTPVLNDIGFTETLSEMVNHYSSLNLFEVQLNLGNEDCSLEKDMQLTLYRIIQEQLNNIVKHAQATVVNISIEKKEASVKLVIEDDGDGFDLHTVHLGLGLNNIQNRAAVFRGTMEIHAAPGKGCKLTVVLPINTEELQKQQAAALQTKCPNA